MTNRAENIFNDSRYFGVEDWTIEQCEAYAALEEQEVELAITANGKTFHQVVAIIKSMDNRKYNPATKTWTVQFDMPLQYKNTVMLGRAKIV